MMDSRARCTLATTTSTLEKRALCIRRQRRCSIWRESAGDSIRRTFGFRGARFDFVRRFSRVGIYSGPDSVRVVRGRTFARCRMTPSSEKARSKSSGESPPRGSDIDNDLGRALSATTHSLARRVRASYRGRSRNRRPRRDAARATARPRSDAPRARPLTSSLASRFTATRERRHGRGGAARLRAAPARDRRRRGVDSGAHPSPLDDAFHPPSPTRPLPTIPTPPRPATVRHDSRDTAARPLAHLPPPPASIRLAAITPSSSTRSTTISSPRRRRSSRDAWSPPSDAPTTRRRPARSPSTRTP